MDKYTKREDIKKARERDWSWLTVLLFEKGLRLQKFYEIGKWFKNSKKDIWNEIKVATAAAKATEKVTAKAAAKKNK